MKNMKYIQLIFLGLFFALIANSCKEEEDVYKTFPDPSWEVNDAIYSVNMTAVVKLPDYLVSYSQSDDKLAAFSDDDVCRGVGYIVDDLYFLTIKGTPEEEVNIKIRYYNKRNQYMYITSDLFQFEQDFVYGTADEPMTLNFTVLK